MRRLIVLLSLLLAAPAYAQTIQFGADVTQADGEATPTLTWDTTPLADNCVASGDWTGSKGSAGTESLPTITQSATYNLTCSWTDDAATLSWTPPTQNTDGSAYTDPAGYQLNYGPGPAPIDLPGNLSTVVSIDDPATTTFVISGLAIGDWSFVIRAENMRGVLSDWSNTALKAITADEQTESIGITINPVPQPPTLSVI